MSYKIIKKQNAAVDMSSGRVGNVRYYTKSGKTYTRTVASDTTNPRSENQMRIRTRWANIVRTYQIAKHFLKSCFESADKATSIYNVFTKYASQCLPIYFTRDQVTMGYCVAAPYAVSQGSLPTIRAEYDGHALISDIAVGDLTMGNNTTVGELAEALVKNGNGIWEYGDYITFFGLQQMGSTSAPYIKVLFKHIELEKGSSDKIRELLGGFTGFEISDGVLIYDASDAGCYTWIHSRNKSGIKVSTQYLVNLNEEFTDFFSDDDQFEDAAGSYGDPDETAPIVDGNDDEDEPSEGYRLTVQSEDTSKGTVSGGGTYEEGDSPTFTAEAKVGYAFEGWYVDDEKISSSNPGTLEMPAEDVTVVAKFVTAETCSLSVESANSSWGLVQIDDNEPADHDAETVNKGTTHTIRAIATSGHYFVEWSDHNSDNPRTVTLTASQNFEASFEQS